MRAASASAELYDVAADPCICNWDARDARIAILRWSSSADMSKQQLIGWGALALGVAFAFAGLFEMLTGEFMPGGYRKDAPWVMDSALLSAFRAWGPYVSGVIWIALALTCSRMGVKILGDMGDARRRGSDPHSRHAIHRRERHRAPGCECRGG